MGTSHLQAGLSNALVLVLCLTALAGSAASQEPAPAPDIPYFTASILQSDARIKTLSVQFDIVVNSKPEPTIFPTNWKSKGEKHALTEFWSNRKYVQAFDGKITRQLHHYGANANTHEATVRDGKVRSVGTKILHPLGYTGRRVWEQDLLEAMEAGRVKVQERMAVEGGASCYVLEGQAFAPDPGATPTGPNFRVWLDPGLGFMPRRMEEYVYGQGATEPVVRNIADEYVYSEVAPGIWHPKSVRMRGLRRQQDGSWTTITTNHVRVSAVEVNHDIPDEEFAPQFPNGTRVSQYAAGGNSLKPIVYTVGGEELDDAVLALADAVGSARAAGPVTPAPATATSDPTVTGTGAAAPVADILPDGRALRVRRVVLVLLTVVGAGALVGWLKGSKAKALRPGRDMRGG